MKKVISYLILASMLLSSIVFALPAYAEPTELDVKWNSGYAVISPLNYRGYTEDYAAASGYSSTDVFTVPKAGTKITWTDRSGFATNSVLTVSSWKEADGKWVLDKDGPMFIGSKGAANNIIETVTSAGVTYTYITHQDNEHLRLCASGTNENIKVYAEETKSASSWSRALAIYPKEPGAPVSSLTGAPQDTSIVEGLKWNYGYVGSTTHSSQANKIKNSSDLYIYSSVFTVPKAGTTVYFYDDNAVDLSNGSYASSNAAIFSHWKKQGSEWVIDTTLPSIDGGSATRTPIGNYALYSYTTTEDNENLRLCYRGALKDYSLSIKPYNVYLAPPADIVPVTQTGSLTSASFKDASGKQIDYKIYLPEGFETGKEIKSLFNIGGGDELSNAVLKDHKNTVLIEFNGSNDDAAKLIEAIISGYKLNAYYLYLYGNTSCCPNAETLFAGMTDGRSYASAAEAANALLSIAPKYYSVLDGITMYAMGDSYFGGSSLGKSVTWVNKLGNKYSMDYENYGIGGSTMSDFVTTNDPMVNRITNMKKTDADIILLEGGRNDRTKLVPLGDKDSRDTKTFYGAVNYMIDYCLEKYPSALIILVTPWKHTGKAGSGYTNVTYADVLKNIAEDRNDPRIVCLYAADPDLTGVDMDKSTFRAQYCIDSSDVSHLNDEGMNFVLPKMEKFIAEAYMQYLGINDTEDTTAEITTEPTPPETSDEVTTGEPTADVTPSATETEPAEEKGCGGSVSFSAVTVIICGAYLVIARKKDDE